MDIKTSQKTSALKKLPIFSGLSGIDLSIIAPILKMVSYRSGEDVIHEGDIGDSLYIITKGSVEVYKFDSGHEEVSLGVLPEGSYFGELSLFDEHPRSATVRTLEDTVFLILSRSDLNRALDGNHKLQSKLYHNTMMETFSRFRKVQTNFTFSQHHLRSRNEILNEINRDLRTATEIQEFFIRAEDDEEVNRRHGIKRSYRYLPSKAIGGDFISIMNDGTGNICAIIADVEGHGISASLVTGVLKSAFSFLAPVCGSIPDRFMSELNLHLCRMLNRLYATCYYAYIDLHRGTVSFAKAGHHHPLFWRGSEKRFESIEANGSLLGLFEDAEYGVETFALNPGDKILFFTDGIIEERSDDVEMFGVSRLEQYFEKGILDNIDPLIDYLITVISDYTDKGSYEDDITLLLYEFS